MMRDMCTQRRGYRDSNCIVDSYTSSIWRINAYSLINHFVAIAIEALVPITTKQFITLTYKTCIVVHRTL